MSKLGYTRKAVDRILDSKPIFDENSGKTFDFIFVDGEHAYENVKSDFQAALRLLNNDGCIVFHDAFTHPGVTRLFKEIQTLFCGKVNTQLYGKWLQTRASEAIKRRFGFCRFFQTDGIAVFRLRP